MNRFSFFISTLLLGMAIQILCSRYLSLGGASPQILLLLVVALGFFKGSLMGESFGFVWGLVGGSLGIHFFGAQSFLLAVAGYGAGLFRRRVASERPAAQVAIAVIATAIYALGFYLLNHIFQEGTTRVLWYVLLMQAIFNVLSVAVIFWMTEAWIRWWKLDQEHP